MQGLLTGRYKTVEDIPDYRSRFIHFDSTKNSKSRTGERGHEALLFKTLDAIRKISEEVKI